MRIIPSVISPRRRVRGPGLHGVVGRVPSRGGTGGVMYRRQMAPFVISFVFVIGLVVHGYGCLQTLIRRGTADAEFNLAGFHHKRVPAFVPEGQRSGRQRYFHSFAFSRFQGDPAEPSQFLDGPFDF